MASDLVPCPACGRPRKPTLVSPWVPDTVCACCGVPWDVVVNLADPIITPCLACGCWLSNHTPDELAYCRHALCTL